MSSALVSRSAWGHEATSEGSQPCIHSTQRARPTLVVLIIIISCKHSAAIVLQSYLVVFIRPKSIIALPCQSVTMSVRNHRVFLFLIKG